MSMQKIRVRAPSNIALIKYMGKKTDAASAGRNIPENPSLSMTLNSLCTVLELELLNDGRDKFRIDSSPLALSSEELRGQKPFPVMLRPLGIEKFEKHYRRVQSRMSELGSPPREDRSSVTIRTLNTFPAGSGIASSASSFAALTLAAFIANSADPAASLALFRGGQATSLKRKLAWISREGSGSSCRSFEGPWVQWDGEEVSSCASALPEMAHFVVVVSAGEKAVSSSEAHLRVKTSPLWMGRVERARERFDKTRQAIAAGDLAAISRIAWAETWEMHSLFHTSAEPFTYWNPGTIEALRFFSGFMHVEQPPIVTLDAGPNIHVIVPRSDLETWRHRLSTQFGADQLLEDGQGAGAEIF